MMQRGCRIAAITAVMAMISTSGAIAAEERSNIQIEKPASAPPENDGGYRPAWADPYAQPPEPGIENDPTPFNPSDVDRNTDTLNINNLDQ
jgi:hypothetical protein